MAAIQDLVLTFCPKMHCVPHKKLKLLMPVLFRVTALNLAFRNCKVQWRSLRPLIRFIIIVSKNVRLLSKRKRSVKGALLVSRILKMGLNPSARCRFQPLKASRNTIAQNSRLPSF